MNIRAVRVEGGIAFVQLTRGYIAVIDAEDAPIVENFNWHAQVQSHAVYARRTEIDDNGKYHAVYLHREIAKPGQGKEVDHQDHDGLNNRRYNLRVCSHSENQYNGRAKPYNTSGLKGASWDKTRRKWVAQIKVNGKSRHLGYFNDVTSAHEAYRKASKELHGSFACPSSFVGRTAGNRADCLNGAEETAK